MHVTISNLKANLSRYPRRVQSGEELIITSHGKPIGKIVPLTESEARTEAEVLSGLRSLLWIRSGDPEVFVGTSNPLPHRAGDRLASDLVSEDRGDRV